MINKKSRVAIIPARGGSKRIKEKNIRPFAKSTLLDITIKFVISTNLFDNIIVSSNCKKTISIASKYGAITTHIRDKHLSSDHAKTIDLEKNLLNKSNYLFSYLFEPTSLIRNKKEIISQIKYFEKSNADSFGSCSLTKSHQDKLFKINEDNIIYNKKTKGMLKRSQDLEKLYEFNGLIYGCNVSSFKKSNPKHGTFGKSLGLISKSIVFDINTMNDFKLAEIVYKSIHEKKSEKYFIT